MIPAEAVEAATDAMQQFALVEDRDGLQSWEAYARLALEAAAPHMQRETVTEWAAAFPTTGNAYNYHRTREEAQAFVDAMKEDGVDMIVMTREVLQAEASEWKPAVTDRGPVFDAAVVAYEAARAVRDHIIDHPDRDISVDEYRARIADAQHKCQLAHKRMVEAWG